ncbi:MAG: TatD family hydrolase [Candidatus Pacebacteria bacterium]|nr:TatD family hydrolase [Candidatus Paceibacterota bacterium]
MEPKYCDVHAHTNFKAYSDDREATIARALEAGVHIMNVGTQQDTSRFAVELAEKYESGVYAAIALHPIHTSASYHDTKELGEEGKAFTSRGEEFDPAFYEELARNPKVRAIGECGLDYYRLDLDTEEKQKKVFIQHIEVANKVGKPLMCHIRNGSGKSAYKDAVEILRKHAKVKGDIHFFAGSWEEAKPFLELGFTLSFTGVLTFTHDYDEVVRNAPLEMLLTETDCPYITPTPFRGQRNEPMHVREVVKAIARIRGEDEEKVRAQLVANAKRVFGF